MTARRVLKTSLTQACALLLVGLLLPSAIGESLALSAAPNYYAVTIKTHQFNMCSTAFASCGSQGGIAARDLVAWFEGSDQPWTISLNEMCEADLQDLVNRTGMPGHMTAARYNASACPGSNKDYGNAVLRNGPLVLGTNRQYRYTHQDVLPCNPSVRECRSAVCATFGSYAGNITTCSTHLENDNSPTIAYDQAVEYRFWATQTYPGGRFLAGDFNMTPTQVPSGYSSQYFKAPSSNTWKAGSLSKQIDYVWHDRAHSLFNTPVSPHCNLYYSDHCYVFARFG